MRWKLIGLDTLEAIKFIKPYKLDIDAKVTVRYIPSGKNKTEKTLNIRFIAIYKEKTDEYHTYFTNIPKQDLLGKDVAALYAARWDIGNLFREVKSENLPGRLKSKSHKINENFHKDPHY
jgi:IS4 transposase